MSDQKTKSVDSESEDSKDVDVSDITDDISSIANDTATDAATDAVPSWSEIAEKLGSKGAKKAFLAYLISGSAIFGASMFTIPFTIGFPFAILVLGFISSIIGKDNVLGVASAGLIGGGAGAAITGGLTAVFTFVPILAGAFGGMVAGLFGVVVGNYLIRKIRS